MSVTKIPKHRKEKQKQLTPAFTNVSAYNSTENDISPTFNSVSVSQPAYSHTAWKI